MQIRISKFSTLEEAREYACRIVDEAAEKARSKYLTSGSGQALEYQSAYEEALAYYDNPDGVYLMLQSDVDAGTVSSLSEAADLILAMRKQWEQMGQVIRTTRLSAKHQIKLATSQQEIAQIREQAIQELDKI